LAQVKENARVRYQLRRRANFLQALSKPAGATATACAVDDSLVARQMQKNLEQAAAEAHQLRDAVARQRAEFDNFRKRTMKEKDQIRDAAREDTLAKLLPVVDNFDRALNSITETSDVSAVKQGIEMVATQLNRILEGEGLERIAALNAPFDPNLHEAIATEDRDDLPDNHVCAEMLPGYRYKERILRAAMVKVSKGGPAVEVAPVPESQKEDAAE